MAKTKPLSLVKVPFWQDDKKVAWLFFGFAFLLYAQTIGYGFALDDLAVVETNNFVHKGFAGIGSILKTFYWAGCPSFETSNSGLFRPLSLILFAAEWQLFEKSPHVFHFVNVVLYALSSFLLYRTLRELFHDYSITLPFLATLLWVVFPAHTEVVANIKSADELLSTIFFLLMMRQLIKTEVEKNSRRILIAGIFFFLSLLSKEGAILFLPVTLLALYLFKKRTIKQLLFPAATLALVTLIWFGWHYVVIANSPMERITYTYHDNALVGAPDLVSRLATALQMQGKYLLKAFTSFPLSYDYSYNENPYVGFGDPFVLLSILVCVGLFVFAILKIKKEPVLSFGILFYFITFALTSNIFMLIGATMADRFLFVPSLGFVIALVWTVMKITKGVDTKNFHANTLYVLILLASLYSLRTFSRSQDWKDQNTLFTADVENAPGSARVHYNYGVVLMGNAQGMTDEIQKKQLNDLAYTEFTTAFNIDSLDIQSAYNLGVVEYRRKNYAESIRWTKAGMKINPKDKSVLGNLADAMTMSGDFKGAVKVYKEAIDNNIVSEDTWNMYGYAYLNLGDTAKALEAFEGSVKHDPKSIKNWDKLGNVSGMSKNYKRSIEAFEEITKLNPNDPKAYFMIQSNYLRMGDTATAMKYLQEYRNHGGN